MKIFKLDLLGIILLIFISLLVIVLPSVLVQFIWNSVVSNHLENNLVINLFQAILLWGAIATLFYITGVFKFGFSFQELEAIDLSTIEDPELRSELEKLKIEAHKKEEEKKKL
jgi:ABC-type multidrug transport system fused ATPase/permease subunit